MANKKISEATAISALELTDMVPVAKSGDDRAYHVTGQVLFDSITPASTSNRGSVELATQAETEAAVDTLRAVTPSGLVRSLRPKHTARPMNYIGQVHTATFGLAEISNLFKAAYGRIPYQGEVVTCDDSHDYSYFLAYNQSGDFWWGLKITGLTASDISFVIFR